MTSFGRLEDDMPVRRARERAALLAGLAMAGAFLLWRIRPHAFAAGGVGAAQPDADIVRVCTWIGWLAAGYLCIGVTVAATARLMHRRAPAGLVPAVLRGLVDSVVSAGLIAMLTDTGVAAAAPRSSHVTTAHHPGAGPRRTALSLDWPDLADRRHAEPRSGAGDEPAAEAVVVKPGDSLWSIASSRLGEHPSASAVAAEWPRWYVANRDLIGPDPDLIRPGERLIPPPAE
jgi:hypothetical protein